MHVFVDFDGTISHEDTTDVLLRRFAGRAWEDIEAQWQSGSIGSQQCLAAQVALIRAEEAEFDSFADYFSIDSHFSGFVRQCGELGLSLTIVSDGFDRIVKRTLDRHNLGELPIRANALKFCGDGKWALDFPHAQDTCRTSAGTCKCMVSRRDSAGYGDHRDLRLLIGDGRSDQCLAEDADFVFARSGLRAYCQDRNVPHRSFHSFDEVQRLMSLLLEHTLVAGDVSGQWGGQEMMNA